MDNKIKKKMFLAGGVTLILSIGCLLVETGSRNVSTVERNGYGRKHTK